MLSDHGSAAAAYLRSRSSVKLPNITRQHTVLLRFSMGTVIISPFLAKRSVVAGYGISRITGYTIPVGARAMNSDQTGSAAFFYLLVLSIILMQLPALALGAEIRTFKLTHFDGSLGLGYTLNDKEYTGGSNDGAAQRRTTFDEELKLNTLSYIFHPNLLEMELGAGIRRTRETLEDDYATNRVKDRLYSVNSKLRFLKSKPYPVELYYNQSNPSMSVGIADSLTLEEKDYGAELALLSPLVSSPMYFRVGHHETTGANSETVTDEKTDMAMFRHNLYYGDRGSGELGISNTVTKSGSGSMNLPIQESETETTSLNWDNRLTFGFDDNIKLVNTIALTRDRRSNVSDRDDGRLYANLDWTHSDSLKSFYTYSLTNTKYDYDKITSQNLNIGMLKTFSDEVSVTTSVDGARDVSDGFSKNTYGINGNIAYRGELNERWWTNAGYSFLYHVNNQDTTVSELTVYDESYVLSGLNDVVLQKEYVIPGTVVVSNSVHTQVYVENVDYILTQVGSETSLARLASGNISDGEEVLIEYAYETGGAYDFDEVNQSMNLGYTLDRRHHFHVSYLFRRKMLRAGHPDNFVDSSKRMRFGTDSRIPLSRAMSLGWKLDLEKQIDPLKPFTRDALGLNFRSALPWVAGFFDLDSRYDHIDNQNSENDLRLTRYSALFSARLGLRSSAQLELVRERDTGGETPNTTSYAKFNYMWQRRLLGFNLEAKYGTEEQGDFSRDDAMIKANLVRKIR